MTQMKFTDYYYNLGYQDTLEKVSKKKKKGLSTGAKLGLGTAGAALGVGAYFGRGKLKGVAEKIKAAYQKSRNVKAKSPTQKYITPRTFEI